MEELKSISSSISGSKSSSPLPSSKGRKLESDSSSSDLLSSLSIGLGALEDLGRLASRSLWML
jgi:hypothetical protein